MEISGWGKTVLSVYNYLERITGAIDRVVKSRAVNAGYYSSMNCSYNDIYSVSEHILNLTERKVKLINLKVLCEEILGSIKEEYARILISTYIDRRKAVDSAKLMDMSIRSFFRKIPLALNSFELELYKRGYNHKALMSLYKDEYWIMEVKNKNQGDMVYNLDNNTFKTIYNEFQFNRQIHSNPTF